MKNQNLKINKKPEREAGITLVALVITVVVMLILAGVAIAAVVDGEGLFSKTRQAAETYENAADKEGYMLENLMGQIDHYIKEEEETPIEETIEVGDYVNYDAGEWTAEDLALITASEGNPPLHSTVNDAETGNQTKPDRREQFGGFEIGDSRNENSTPYDTDYEADYSGWRVWDIDESTGEITLISAGHPETYYHRIGHSEESINILRNRDCSMYENQYAKSGSAHILTGQEAVEWYNRQFNTNYTLIDNNYSDSTFYHETFTRAEPISVLENGSYYWLASPDGTTCLYYVNPISHYVSTTADYARGVRVLVSLESDVQVKEGAATEGVTTWDIVGN